MFKSLFLSFIIVERSEKLTVMTLLVSSRNAGNFKLFWFQDHSAFQRKTTQNPKLALSNSPKTKKLKENGL